MNKSNILLTIPPRWYWIICEGVGGILFYIAYRLRISPGALHPDSYCLLISIGCFLSMLFSCIHYAAREDAIIIMFLGVRIRKIPWKKIIDAVFVYDEVRKNEGAIFLTIHPKQKTEADPKRIMLQALLHPFKIVILMVPPKQEYTCIEVFKNYCHTFSIYQNK